MTETRNMNTTSTRTSRRWRGGAMREEAGASVVVAWSRKGPLPAAPWGVPLLLACSVGVTKLRSRHGTPLSTPGAGGGMGDLARSGIWASEPRRLREYGEPVTFPFFGKGAIALRPAQRRGGVQRSPTFGAGTGRREARKIFYDGRCRVANPAGSRAEPGRRRPGGGWEAWDGWDKWPIANGK